MGAQWVVDVVGVSAVFFFEALAVGFGLGVTNAEKGGFWFSRACFVAGALSAVGSAAIRSGTTAGVIVAVVMTPLTIAALRWVNGRQRLISRTLFAGALPNPPSAPATPDGALLVLWGSNASWSTGMPHTVIQMGQRKVLAITNTPKGKGLLITALEIFDDRGEVIAHIEDNDFWVKDGSRAKRPDASTLVVFDHNNAEVLRVRLLNRTTLSVLGVFRAPGSPVVVLAEDQTAIGTNVLQRCVFGNCAVDVRC